nr:arginine decarboxylase [Flavilitoribacter sp.]
YYNAEIHESQVYLPSYDPNDKEPLYLGFFHTGAYQDSISGYGGIKHCLIPSPKHILIDKDAQGNLVDRLYQPEQSAESMLKVLGY